MLQTSNPPITTIAIVVYGGLFTSQCDSATMDQLLESDYEVPTWVAVLLVVAIVGTLGYGLVVGTLAGPLAFWAGVLRLALTLLVVYLFWRFVVAVELIAQKV